MGKDIIRVIIESMPSSSSWVTTLSALLTPLVAIMAIYIAYQQYRLNHIRLKHELYERRLQVYRSVQKFLSEIVQNGNVDYPRISGFYAEASEAIFLFKKEVQEYIDSLYEKAVDLSVLDKKISSSNGELLKWFFKQLPVSKELFSKHIRVN